jgi:hypothetical protein
MPQHARVSSIEAIEAFKNSLVIYLAKAGRLLDEVSEGVVRTRLWLEHDQRLHLENQVRQRTRALDLKQQELFSARFAESDKVMPLQQAAVREAKRAVTEAEEKLARLRHWHRQYDHLVVPVAREADKLREILERDLRQAVHFLVQAVEHLHAYAETRPAGPPAVGGAASLGEGEADGGGRGPESEAEPGGKGAP